MKSNRPEAIPTIQIDNERVIVTQWRFPAGAETTWHTHQYDYVVVPQTTGQLEIESSTGVTKSDLIAGVSYSREKGMHHNVVNPNASEFVFIEIELK